MNAADHTLKTLDEAGYTVIPPSGTFRDLIEELDFIIGHLGCRIVQLLPIHPTPTTYARMGRFGSPYAALSFTAVDPALAEFDPKATPLEQFVELVDAVHARGARLFIDIAINHTGWAASLHETHPGWLSREADGQIENPGAWGVVWADLTRLDYGHRDLWQYMADVFLTWCRRGVDGFRCDAGYMIPTAAWRYMIGKVRDQFPNVIFLLEGLGGKISVTRDLLNWADFNWAYSELFSKLRPGTDRSLPSRRHGDFTGRRHGHPFCRNPRQPAPGSDLAGLRPHADRPVRAALQPGGLRICQRCGMAGHREDQCPWVPVPELGGRRKTRWTSSAGSTPYCRFTRRFFTRCGWR